MPNQIDKLDQLLREYTDDDHENCDDSCGLKADYSELIEEILKHYISREEVLGKLPERKNEYGVPPRRTGEDGSGFTEGVPDWGAIGYNQAISDMRQALTTNVKE